MRYIPFLKLKKNEVSALTELTDATLSHVTPLFDIPRIKDMTGADFIDRIRIGLKALTSKWNPQKGFYIDVFDIPPDLKPAGQNIYSYTLAKFNAYKVIPVVGLDRDEDHISSVIAFLRKKAGKLKIAIRLLPTDFANFDAVRMEINDLLGESIRLSKSVDLLLDARTLSDKNVKEMAVNAAIFANKFAKSYGCRRIVMAGSSIPSSLLGIVRTNSEKTFPRLEKELWATFKLKCKVDDSVISFGDYSLVSPEYSDIDISPQIFPNVATPKIIYTCDQEYYAVRGAAFKTHPLGYRQYFALAKKIVSQPIFRGRTFSAGDKYIYERGSGKGTSGSPGSWIKTTVNSHVTFIIQDILTAL
jgi:hypothetical protein